MYGKRSHQYFIKMQNLSHSEILCETGWGPFITLESKYGRTEEGLSITITTQS